MNIRCIVQIYRTAPAQSWTDSRTPMSSHSNNTNRLQGDKRSVGHTSYGFTKHVCHFCDVLRVDGFSCCVMKHKGMSQSKEVLANSESLANQRFVCVTTRNAMLHLIIHSGFETVTVEYPQTKKFVSVGNQPALFNCVS